MIQRLVVGIALVSGLVAAAAWAVPSKCDFGVSKAIGKKVSCECGVIAVGQKKGLPPDGAKLSKCEDKFTAACGKAKTAGDCSVQTRTCAALGDQADSAIDALCLNESPSGAFLN
ncbi:MAG TPA: hypothetical protein VKW76_06915 [Candidatus Binatia bacterium]|nr:hypothetical protein [Candidatus Binatia bacterium]